HERVGGTRLAQSGNDVRWFNGTGRTSGTTRSANAFDVQSTQQHNAVRAIHHKGNRIVQALPERTDQLGSWNGGDAVDQLPGQWLQGLAFENRGSNESLHGFHQPDDPGKIFCARPPFVLMSAAKNHRVGMKWRFDIEQADAFRTMELVGANRNQV